MKDKQQLNTHEQWQAYFAPGGQWELNEGRRQTRLFAEYFHRHIYVPLRGRFSVLDVGCALGDAIPVWHRHYPDAELSGCDFAPAAVERCREVYGNVATFFQAGWADLQGSWDVIYCSNVLEHFVNRVEIARRLLSHCRILYVMTPYKEREGGRDITSMNDCGHVGTLYRGEFDSVGKVRTKVMRAPIAWGDTAWQEFKNRIGMYRRFRRYRAGRRRQIVYTITQSVSL